MTATPLAQPAPMSESEWRSFVIAELRFLREQARDNGKTLEILLEMAKDEEKHEADHG